jgi:hypothetical protein
MTPEESHIYRNNNITKRTRNPEGIKFALV